MTERTCSSCTKQFEGKERGKAVCKSCLRQRKHKRAKLRAEKWNSLPPHKCATCGIVKPRTAYYDPNKPMTCRACHKKKKKLSTAGILTENHKDKYWFLYLKPEEQRKYARRRYLRQKQATPGWFEKEEVKALYKLAKDIGMQVDHIIPLFHHQVCGLHCRDNLQLMSQKSNFHKGNEFNVI